MASVSKRKRAINDVPSDLTEVAAPHPLEISGVAAIPGGYAVVGDENPKHGWIWPAGLEFKLPGKLKGPESIDVGFAPDGSELWLVLGEKKRKLVDLQGGKYTFGKEFDEIAGRGLEGVAVCWHNSRWQVAVCWEGGYFDRKTKLEGEFTRPRVALLSWEPGKKQSSDPEHVFELDVVQPSKGQRFRAADLAWDAGHLLVLLASTDKTRRKKAHTWLQRFDLDGRRLGDPVKLEELWGPYRDDKNWEALDYTLDGKGLVLGYDEKDETKHRALVVFDRP